MNALAFQQRAQNTLLENGVERLHIGHGQGGVVKAHRFEKLVQRDGAVGDDTGPIQLSPIQKVVGVGFILNIGYYGCCI